MNLKLILSSWLIASMTVGCAGIDDKTTDSPVDYVNPYMGNISHLLVPTFPNVHLPNSMLRMVPERADYTSDKLNGLPIVVTNHREKSAFNLSPFQGVSNAIAPVIPYTYDNEVIKPYYYSVLLDEAGIAVKFAPSRQSAVYEIGMNEGDPAYIILNTKNGCLKADGRAVKGYQVLDNNVKVYIYLEGEQMPISAYGICGNEIRKTQSVEGNNAAIALYYGESVPTINLRYGISFISEDQAKKNLRREINNYDVDSVANAAKTIWNETLAKFDIETDDIDDKTVFYTSLYRTYERPICLSEDGRYFSASDGKIHEDNGRPFYTDDWIWDTYRAAHPLRVISEPDKELDIIHSYLRMAQQTDSLWMPTFPEITGDTRRMNCNHGVATIADACCKGLVDFDIKLAFDACRKGIEEKTLAPWSAAPAGEIDKFYRTHGYVPALANGEIETAPEVNSWEKRQPVAVTLGTSYDQWCLSQIASYLGDTISANKYLKASYNYRNLFNPDTKFFHPKDKDGNFIQPFDYSLPGGPGARDYYGENNGWIYRWDVPHNIDDLITLMGGKMEFCRELNRMFSEPLGRSKYDFFAIMPDHTGNVGQFSMANEPSLHIPYLYNHAGQPWMTQKRIRQLVNQWFRNDLMGLPGDEDGGGMSAFVVFSMLGFYPVTPGSPVYDIGTPFFKNAKVHLPNGRIFEIVAHNCSKENKYIQKAKLNGKCLNMPYIRHEDIMNGGRLVFEMGNRANLKWGTDASGASSTI